LLFHGNISISLDKVLTVGDENNAPKEFMGSWTSGHTH
jgi:hypothetical protein